MRKNNLGKLHQTAAIITAMAMAISSPMTILADTVENETKTESSSEKNTESKNESSENKSSEKETEKSQNNNETAKKETEKTENNNETAEKETEKTENKNEIAENKSSEKETEKTENNNETVENKSSEKEAEKTENKNKTVKNKSSEQDTEMGGSQNESSENDDDFDPSVKPEAPAAPEAPEAFSGTAPTAPVKPVLPVKDIVSAPNAPELPEKPVQPNLEGLSAEEANALIDDYNVKVAAYNEAAAAYNESIDQYNSSAEDYNANEASFEELMAAYNASVAQYNLDAETYNAELAQYLNDLAAYKTAADDYNAKLENYAKELEKYNLRAEQYDAYIAGVNAEAELHNAEEDAKVAASQAEVDEYERQLAEWSRRREERVAIQEGHESVIQAQYDALGDISRITRDDIFGNKESDGPAGPDLSSIGYFDKDGRLVISWDKMKRQEDAKTIEVIKSDNPSGLTYNVINVHVYMKYKDIMDAICNGDYINNCMEKGWELEWHDDAVSLPKSLLDDMLIIEYETLTVDKNDIVFFTNQANLFPTLYSSRDAAGSVSWKSTENTLMTGRYLEGRTSGDYWANDGMYTGNAKACDANGNLTYDGIAGLNAGYTYRYMDNDLFEIYQEWKPNYINLYHQCTYNWFTWDSNLKPKAVAAYNPEYVELQKGAEKLENNYGALEIPEAEGEELSSLGPEEVENHRVNFLERLGRLNGLSRRAIPETVKTPENEEKTPEQPKTPETPKENPETKDTEEVKASAENEADVQTADRNDHGSGSLRSKSADSRKATVYTQQEEGIVLGAAREENAEGEVLGAARIETVTPDKGVLGANRNQNVKGANRNQNVNGATRNPMTGDETRTILWAVMSLAALAGLYIWSRFHERKEDK